MVPLLVRVPEISVALLFCSVKLPALVTLVRNMLEPLTPLITPVPVVDRVPPVKLTLFSRFTMEPAAAVIFPPVLVQVPPERTSVPPPVASSVPVLVFVQEAQVSGLTSRFWPLMLALIVPELTKFNSPSPTVPAPTIFEEVVRTAAAVP